MVARVLRLRTRPDRLRAEQAELLLEALRPFEAAMPDAVRGLRAHIHRQTASLNGWTFIMLSSEQFIAVSRWLRACSTRPMAAMVVWSELFAKLDPDTGQVMLSRDELANLAGIEPKHVSTIMGELESIGAVIRRRERVAGMRGPGRVRYLLNPMVATNLAGRARDEAQAAAPPLLALIEGGGKPPRPSRT